MHVRAKKHLGQHFLTDPTLAQKIVAGIQTTDPAIQILEIGPGKGILTQYLLAQFGHRLKAIDIDHESIQYLKNTFPFQPEQLMEGDFLDQSSAILGSGQWAVIGNFPYNISSQIIFKVLENRHRVVELVGMFQKEVADRFRSKPSTKEYGILSVLVQAFFRVDYLFSVKPGSFYPPPKVTSGVIRLVRKQDYQLGCHETGFFKVVKAGFNQRRKTLRNSLQGDFPKIKLADAPFAQLRAEALTVQDFVALTAYLYA